MDGEKANKCVKFAIRTLYDLGVKLVKLNKLVIRVAKWLGRCT